MYPESRIDPRKLLPPQPYFRDSRELELGPLAESIASIGLTHPPRIYPVIHNGELVYRVLDGWRRVSAIVAADLPGTIPVVLVFPPETPADCIHQQIAANR